MPILQSNEKVIKTVLEADSFELHKLTIIDDKVSVSVTNTKFRSTAQAIGRVASTLQRFTADYVKFADIHFYSNDLNVANYRVNLDAVTTDQFNPRPLGDKNSSIYALTSKTTPTDF